MPCDTIYETTPMQIAKLDQAILAQSLEIDGWHVERQDSNLTATRLGATLRVSANGSSLSVRSGAGSNRQAELQRQISQGYGALAAKMQASKFGFNVLAQRRLSNNAIELTLTRKVGL